MTASQDVEDVSTPQLAVAGTSRAAADEYSETTPRPALSSEERASMFKAATAAASAATASAAKATRRAAAAVASDGKLVPETRAYTATPRSPRPPPAATYATDSPRSPDLSEDGLSPRERHDRDNLILAHLRTTGRFPKSFLQTYAKLLLENERLLQEKEKEETDKMSVDPTPGGMRRTRSQRSPDDEEITGTPKMARTYAATIRRAADHTAEKPEPASKPATKSTPQFSRKTETETSETKMATATVSLTETTHDGEKNKNSDSYPPNSQANAKPEAARKTRYPPLVVEELPEWTTHFKELKKMIGRAPNARPFGQGVRFTPTDGEEYRVIQRYLAAVEPKLSWFSYSLPQDKDVKIAIRGLLANTEPEEVKAELLSLGFQADYVRRIRTRKGRPGCLFFAILKKTPGTIPEIFEMDELLSIPGIKVEPWRGKKGPAQCHRCQQFRHSSHCCHRKLACVRCGEEHTAKDCPRPLTEPATCANCRGPHPASSKNCPIMKREMRNKKAGTVALTAPASEATKAQRAAERPNVQEHAPSSLMAPANDPISRSGKARGQRPSAPPKEDKKKPQSKKADSKTTAPAAGKDTANKSDSKKEKDKFANVTMAIETLQCVLDAIKTGEDPVPVILRGISDLIRVNYG